MSRAREVFINEDTTSFGVGSVTLDVDMARRHGWSERAIRRVAGVLAAISRRETNRSHRKGRVPKCPCVHCTHLGRYPCGDDDCRKGPCGKLRKRVRP